MGSIFFEKNNFPVVFHISGANFSSFRQNCSSTVDRTALVSRFFIRIDAIFFELFANFHWLVCQNATLRVHRIVFMGSLFFELKKFPIVFHILGGNCSGFRQNFSSTVDRTALVSMFFNRSFANFFRSSRKILLTSQSELHSKFSLDYFHWNILFGENTFPFPFHILGGTF